MEKLALIALLTLLAIPLHAADVSDLTYDASGPTITITDCDKAASGELIIPASIEGKPVTSIEEAIFQNCDGLTSITIPDSVTSIGKYAFSRCTSLTSITIPDGVTSVGYGAFYMCSSLTSITFRGNAPTLDDDVFLEAPANAKVFIYEGASGFSPEDGKFDEFSVVVQKKPIPPKIISVVGAGDIIPMSSLIITFTSGIGSNYAIERSRDLVNWVTLLIIAGEESSTEFTDNEPINDGGGVFYRIREGQ